jgi:hypothetical protein
MLNHQTTKLYMPKTVLGNGLKDRDLYHLAIEYFMNAGS